ncbi:MAG: hypothetical protein ACLFOY_00565 [Desulfatibacillaceae bacterium]
MEQEFDFEAEIDEMFEDLGEAESQPDEQAAYSPGLIETMHEQEQRLESWRVLMVEYVIAASAFFAAARKGDVSETRLAIDRIMEILPGLNQAPGHAGSILIRHVGRGVEGEGTVSERWDYSVHLGALRMDMDAVKAIVQRRGSSAVELDTHARRALDALASFGILTVQAPVGPKDAKIRDLVRFNFNAMAAYFTVICGGAIRNPSMAARLERLPIVYDEKGRPDPNLTCLAAMSGMSARAMQNVVRKVAAQLADAGPGHVLSRYAGVYDAIFAFEKMRKQLVRPPVEVNNPRWLVSTHRREAVREGRSRVVRMVVANFGKWSQDTSRTTDSLYAEDFGSIGAFQLAERLTLATRLLDAAKSFSITDKKGKAAAQAATSEVLRNLRTRLLMVRDEVLEDLIVEDGLIEARVGGVGRGKRRCDTQVLELVRFLQQRSATKAKMKTMLTEKVVFGDEDYENISRDFGITPQEAEELVGVLRGCFAEDRTFLRPEFEKSIPTFLKNEDKVFEFLWHYLEENLRPQDRIAFLNSLQVYIDRMKAPYKTLNILMRDFVHDPEVVRFSDRNALMLANSLLRRYNKELHQDIEKTPADVLKVKSGLDEGAVRWAARLIEDDRERFFSKVRTIHRWMREALDPETCSHDMPVRFLITLEWELYLYLSLIGGNDARVVVESALREYGSPESEIYHQRDSRKWLPYLITLLEASVRGLARVSGSELLSTLLVITPRTEAFAALSDDPAYKEQVNTLMAFFVELIQELYEKEDMGG